MHMVQIQIKISIAFGYADSHISSFIGPDSIVKPPIRIWNV